MSREPGDATKLAARLARAYPSLSIYSAASLAEELCRIERAQRRHAERCCSGEDGGYARPKRVSGGYVKEHDPDAEARAERRIESRIAQFWKRLAACFPNNAYSLGLDDVHQFRLLTGPGWRETLSAACIVLQGDPRGPVLLLQLPGEGEAVAV